MLRATFIGHQGWLLSSEETNVLVDPLLVKGFGHAGLAGSVFPPRRFDFDSMPNADAVWLTHEHDDHVCFESLCRLGRSVPIYVSSRSSIALCDALEDTGFTVRRVAPGATVRLGTLTFETFVGEHRGMPAADEWDALPFLATDAACSVGFASSVDVAMPDALLDAVAASSLERWILCIANNTTDARFVDDSVGLLEPLDDTDALARVLTRRWQTAAARASPPCFTAVTGGGWTHPVAMSWIDRVAFCIDPDRLAASLVRACSTRACAMRPGDEVRVSARTLTEVRSDWVAPAPAVRPTGAARVPHDFAPATGSRSLDADGWLDLEAGLRDLARYLYGSEFFAAAHSVASDHPLGVLIHDDAGDRLYAWSPASADFVSTETTEFECRLRVWGTDLRALFEGTVAASALCYSGRVRCWNRDSDALRISPQLLWMFAHPLHRPEAARRLYDRLLAASTSRHEA